MIERARALGAFRFNTGKLMRIGTAARHWATLEPDAAQYGAFRDVAGRGSGRLKAAWSFATFPSAWAKGCAGACAEPPATLLVLPNGRVKVAAALPHVCADLRREDARAGVGSVPRRLARCDTMRRRSRAIEDESRHAKRNRGS